MTTAKKSDIRKNPAFYFRAPQELMDQFYGLIPDGETKAQAFYEAIRLYIEAKGEAISRNEAIDAMIDQLKKLKD